MKKSEEVKTLHGRPKQSKIRGLPPTFININPQYWKGEHASFAIMRPAISLEKSREFYSIAVRFNLQVSPEPRHTDTVGIENRTKYAHFLDSVSLLFPHDRKEDPGFWPDSSEECAYGVTETTANEVSANISFGAGGIPTPKLGIVSKGELSIQHKLKMWSLVVTDGRSPNSLKHSSKIFQLVARHLGGLEPSKMEVIRSLRNSDTVITGLHREYGHGKLLRIKRHKSEVVVRQQRHEYALQWLWKSMPHRTKHLDRSALEALTVHVYVTRRFDRLTSEQARLHRRNSAALHAMIREALQFRFQVKATCRVLGQGSFAAFIRGLHPFRNQQPADEQYHYTRNPVNIQDDDYTEFIIDARDSRSWTEGSSEGIIGANIPSADDRISDLIDSLVNGPTTTSVNSLIFNTGEVQRINVPPRPKPRRVQSQRRGSETKPIPSAKKSRPRRSQSVPRTRGSHRTHHRVSPEDENGRRGDDSTSVRVAYNGTDPERYRSRPIFERRDRWERDPRERRHHSLPPSASRYIHPYSKDSGHERPDPIQESETETDENGEEEDQEAEDVSAGGSRRRHAWRASEDRRSHENGTETETETETDAGLQGYASVEETTSQEDSNQEDETELEEVEDQMPRINFVSF